MRVAVVGDFPSRAPHWIGIEEGLKELGHEFIPVVGGQAVPENDFTLFGSLYEGKPTCYWYCDYIHGNGKIPQNAPVFFSYREYVSRYNGIWLPQASVKRKEIDRSEPNNDIIFIGNPNPNVEFHHLYEERRRILSMADIRIYNGQNKDERNTIFDRLPKIIGNAGVVLGCDAARFLDFGMSNRVWNVLGNGGFYLTMYAQGMETVFENGKHLVWAKTPEELIFLANYYQKNQLEARRIAEEGFRFVQENHTYRRRLEMMFYLMSDVR